MMTPGRRLLLVLIMLWLPLQGALAASMSLCAKENDSVKLDASVPDNAGMLPCVQEKTTLTAPDKPLAVAADQHHEGNHKQSIQGAADEVSFNLQCNGGPCQSSCSAPIPSAASAAIFDDSSVYTPSFTSRFTSLVSAQLQRPPLV